MERQGNLPHSQLRRGIIEALLGDRGTEVA